MRQSHFRPLALLTLDQLTHNDRMTIHTLLMERGFDFQGMSEINNGVRKPTWLILLDQNQESDQLQQIEDICKVYNQTGFIYSGADRETKQINLDGTEKHLGALTASNRYEALSLPSYFVRADDGNGLEYFVVRNVQ